MTLSYEQKYLMDTVRAWFDEAEQITHYAGELKSGPTPAELFLLGQLPRDGQILDVGCGAGRIAIYLAEKGYQVIGTDVSEQLLNVAKEHSMQNNQPIKFIQNEGVQLPFKDAEFDVVIGFKVLCYIPTRELRAEALREYSRVLKPGGTCILTQYIVPEEAMEDARDEYFEANPAASFDILEEGDNFPLGKGYVHWFTEPSLQSELAGTSLTIEIFEDDSKHGGAGYLYLIKMKN
ncbi:Ubiquinone/menaquinone biosynthesis C-methylase UbiE [Paenibacillaceae bacterium GAS479]|nr:Ubiquinone/menaquinone biosynthesis C-methylase UbiE [Paenibacillaceae bacterium GAS479]